MNLFLLTDEDAQIVAERMGLKRKLTHEELRDIKKCLEVGFQEWVLTMKSAIQAAVNREEFSNVKEDKR
jgi:hypothetical protein